MKKFNVAVPKKYTDKSGEEKTFWGNVGKLTYFPKTEDREAGFTLDMYMFPDTKFGVFEDKPRDDKF